MQYPQVLADLIECYKKLPGVGEKTAERMALSTLDMDEEILELFGGIGACSQALERLGIDYEIADFRR